MWITDSLRYSAHADCVWAFCTFTNFELYLVAFAEVIKGYALKFVNVEEEVLCFAFLSDKSVPVI